MEVGGFGVAVGGTGVLVGGFGVAVGGMGVGVHRPMHDGVPGQLKASLPET